MHCEMHCMFHHLILCVSCEANEIVADWLLPSQNSTHLCNLICLHVRWGWKKSSLIWLKRRTPFSGRKCPLVTSWLLAWTHINFSWCGQNQCNILVSVLVLQHGLKLQKIEIFDQYLAVDAILAMTVITWEHLEWEWDWNSCHCECHQTTGSKNCRACHNFHTNSP